MTQTTTNNVDQLRISWTAGSGYTGIAGNTITYQVQYRTCATPASNCTGWSSGTATDVMFDIPVNNLRDNMYYQARVRANGSTIGGYSLFSAESLRYPVTIADPNNTPSNRADDTVTVGTGV